jgi:hypothetical protein
VPEGNPGRDLTRPRPGPPVVDPEDLAAGHETSDLSIAAVLIFVGGLLTALTIAFVAVSLLQVSFSGLPFRLAPPGAGLEEQPSGPLPPAPRLQTVPGQELQELRARQEAQLQGYGWLDRQAGRVRIPIERAMDLLAERGLPARSTGEAERFQDQAIDAPSGASSGRIPEVVPR